MKQVSGKVKKMFGREKIKDEIGQKGVCLYEQWMPNTRMLEDFLCTNELNSLTVDIRSHWPGLWGYEMSISWTSDPLNSECYPEIIQAASFWKTLV